jgi:hypothetical protein
MSPLAENVVLAVIGVLVGTVGTIVGAGGGFLLTPILMVLYPSDGPQQITSLSLTVVFFNALSGSIAYARAHRIHYRLGAILATATVPGAVLGAIATGWVPRPAFDWVFGTLLLLVAGVLFARPVPAGDGGSGNHDTIAQPPELPPRRRLGMAGLLSIGVGFASSLLGIGGGILHVPILVQILGVPAHFATATSHFTLAIMAFAGAATHLVAGTHRPGLHGVVPLSLGVIVGAQVGAALSRWIRGELIIRVLAACLAFVAFRIIVLVLTRG